MGILEDRGAEMALILLWLGGLSLAGCIIWVALFGLTTETVLVMVASLFVAFLGFRGMDRVRRLKSLENLGFVYVVAGLCSVMAFILLDARGYLDFSPPQSLPFWLSVALIWAGTTAALAAVHLLEKAGVLLDLRRQPAAPANIRFEVWEVDAGYTQGYGYITIPITRPIGRVFVAHQAQLPCVIRAKGGSVSVYEIPAYETWLARKTSRRRKWLGIGKVSYHDNPFKVPKDIKPPSALERTLVANLGELVTRLQVISKQHKGDLIELTPDRISVLLKKHEVTREELARTCDLLLRVEAMLDDYTKGDRVT